MGQTFDALGQKPQQNRQQALQEIKSNPVAYLKRMGYNLPQGVNTQNPESIINGLIQSGQIGGNKVRQIMSMFRR